MREHEHVVQKLIALDADVSARTSNGREPLHVAASSNHHDTVILMLIGAGADVNAVDGHGRIPLKLASRSLYSAPVDALLAAGALVDIHDSEFGWHVLNSAAHKG